MATREVKARLSLDGEQEYKAKIKQAESALKLLRSELKADTAEMGKNATAQEKAAAKAKSLKAQIAEQEKIVKTLTEALKEAQEKYADNQQEQNRWAVQLNNARTTLANMRNQLAQTTDAMKDFSGGVKEAVTDMKDDGVQAVASFGDAIDGLKGIASNVSESIKSVFGAMSSTISSAAQGIFNLMSQAWTAAGKYGELSTIWGGTTVGWENLMTGAKAEGFAGGDVEGLVSNLVERAHSGDKTAKAAMRELGLYESDNENHLEFFLSAMELLSSDKYTDEQRLLYSEALFGKGKATTGSLMASKWGGIVSKADSIFSTGGAGVAGVNAQMEGASDAWNFLMTNWTSFQEFLGSDLTIKLGFEVLTNDATDILQDVMKLFGATDEAGRIEASVALSADMSKFIEDFTTGLGNLFTGMHDIADSLMASDDPKIQAVGKLMDKLADLGDWFVQNIDDLLKILDLLAGPLMYNWLTKLLTGKSFTEWGGTIVNTGLDVAKTVGFFKAGGAIKGLLAGGAGVGGAAGAAGAAASGAGAAGVGGAAAAEQAATKVVSNPGFWAKVGQNVGNLMGKAGNWLTGGGLGTFLGGASVVAGELGAFWAGTDLMDTMEGNANALQRDEYNGAFSDWSEAGRQAAEEWWVAFNSGSEQDEWLARQNLMGFGEVRAGAFMRAIQDVYNDEYMKKSDWQQGVPEWFWTASEHDEEGVQGVRRFRGLSTLLSGDYATDAELMQFEQQRIMRALSGADGGQSPFDKVADSTGAAVMNALHGMGVYIDGTAAGHILAPTISEELAVGYITD